MQPTALSKSSAPRLMPNVIRTRKKTSDPLLSGSLRLLGRHRSASLLRNGLVSRGSGTYSSASISVATTGEEGIASGCCGHRGHADHVGIRWRGHGDSRTAARSSPVGGGRLVHHLFGQRSCTVGGLDSTAEVRVSIIEQQRSVATAPLCGLFETSCTRERSICRGARFDGPYNTRPHLTAPPRTSFTCSPW